jgi:hypothetical protein
MSGFVLTQTGKSVEESTQEKYVISIEIKDSQGEVAYQVTFKNILRDQLVSGDEKELGLCGVTRFLQR